MKGTTYLRNKTITPDENDSQLKELEEYISKNMLCSINIKCPDCGNYHLMEHMFRCYYCHFYICDACAEKHFKSEGG